MSIKQVSQASIDNMGGIAAHAVQISRLVKTLVSDLKTIYAGEASQERWGVAFKVHMDGLGVDLRTPFGIARGGLYMLFDGKDASGRWVVEKAVRGREGAEAWKAIWEIRFAKDGSVYPCGSETALFSFYRLDPDEKASGVLALADALACAIAETPVFSEHETRGDGPVDGAVQPW
jgi:hypothetical protein